MYSVPSRLIGTPLRVHLYNDRLVCYLGGEETLELARIREKRGRRIDYNHVISSLAQKPQAFRYSILRNDLLPDATYKEIWHYLDKLCSARQACKQMVSILKLASDSKQQGQLGIEVLGMLTVGKIPVLGGLQEKYASQIRKQSLPQVVSTQHSLADYDKLLTRVMD